MQSLPSRAAQPTTPRTSTPSAPPSSTNCEAALPSQHSPAAEIPKSRIFSETKKTVLRHPRKCNLTILGAYRCCPYITTLAASLLADLSERQTFLNQTKTAQREKLTPLLYIAANADEEKNHLVQIIKDRQLTGDRIAILLPNNAKLFSIAGLLTKAGLEVEVPSRQRQDIYPTHDFKSERPKLLTYYGAKGLTFETVIMPRLVPNSFLIHRIQPKPQMPKEDDLTASYGHTTNAFATILRVCSGAVRRFPAILRIAASSFKTAASPDREDRACAHTGEVLPSYW
ncbi:MAG: hypothetical protein GX590_08640 [Lentisphaerae bacterium]|nr:hypothetical protein [Lentisphaerota bacterium]